MTPAPRGLLRIVDSKPSDTPAARYVARILWRCDVDPDWEIDTRHPGFGAWREAACFANGLSEEDSCILFLYDGALVLQLVNGRDVVVDRQDIVIWQRANPKSSDTPDDINFVRASEGPDELSALGLDAASSRCVLASTTPMDRPAWTCEWKPTWRGRSCW